MRYRFFASTWPLLLVLLSWAPEPAQAETWTVAPVGGDFTSVQAALDVAQAGDTILVQDKPGGYREQITFPRSGNATLGPIRLAAYPGHTPALDGTDSSGEFMVLIENRSHLTIEGFEIRNSSGLTDGSGVRILGSGSHITVRDNRIHEMRGVNAMGITVYGTSTTASISNLTIEGNEVFDCDPAPSEAITLNGNVELFTVVANHVHDVNNIGIDFIGGETEINPTFVARSGVCRGNRVVRANSSYGGGYGAGIYVDGGRDILIERNIVTACDLGIEIGAENAGFDATGIIVRNNIVHHNDKVGIVFGGFQAGVGRTRDCVFENNTCYENDTTGQFLGEIWVQYASNNLVRNNIFAATAQNVLLYSEGGNQDNSFDTNLWYAPGGENNAEWVWQGTGYSTFADYRAGSGQDSGSSFADPAFIDAGGLDFALTPSSPAVDAGDPADLSSGLAFDGNLRLLDGDLDGVLRIDAGAFEFAHVRLKVGGTLLPGETLTLEMDGSNGMSTWLLAGPPGLRLRAPFGHAYIDLPALLKRVPLGNLPVLLQKTVPPLAPGTEVVLQAAVRTGGRGNLSNPIHLTVE